MSVLYLVITTEDQAPRRYRFTKREVIIGRAKGSDITLAQQKIARWQCRISVEGARILLDDLGSPGGTFLNHSRLRPPALLHPYDQVQIGEATLSAYLDEAADEGPTPLPLLAQAEDLHQQPWDLYKESTQLRRRLAARPDAPAWLLEELSQSFDLLTLQAVSENPNTTPRLLSLLAACCAAQVLRNPSLPLLLLEDPLLSQLSPDALVSLLSLPNVEQSFLDRFATHPEAAVQRAATKQQTSRISS